MWWCKNSSIMSFCPGNAAAQHSRREYPLSIIPICHQAERNVWTNTLMIKCYPLLAAKLLVFYNPAFLCLCCWWNWQVHFPKEGATQHSTFIYLQLHTFWPPDNLHWKYAAELHAEWIRQRFLQRFANFFSIEQNFHVYLASAYKATLGKKC